MKPSAYSFFVLASAAAATACGSSSSGQAGEPASAASSSTNGASSGWRSSTGASSSSPAIAAASSSSTSSSLASSSTSGPTAGGSSSASPNLDAGTGIDLDAAGAPDATTLALDGSGGTTSRDGGHAANPFGCKFGWGEPSPNGSLGSYGWLQFMTTWLGSEVQANGTPSSCGPCGWLNQLKATNVVPAFYAYIIGFYGHANGLPDGNQTTGANLTTGGSALILGAANAACPPGQLCAANKIVQAYAWYAQQAQRVWPTKPSVWLLEGDFVQYAGGSQSRPLTYAQLGQLAALITTAIKTNMPNAIVAIDHSTWNSNMVTDNFWSAMAQADYDMVWTTGVGNNNGFISSGTNASSYNGATDTYAYLRKITGRKILVDESAGLSQASDTWSNQTAATINARIAEGVVGINVSGAPSNYAANVAALAPQLAPICP